MDVHLCSQDIFKSSQSQFPGPAGSPTKGVLLTEWRCEEATEASFITCSLSWGSHHLPSLGIAESLPDIVEIDKSKLCSSEFVTVEGIDELTRLAMKHHFQVVKNGKAEAVTDLLHVLSVFENLGIGGKLPEDVLSHLDQSLLMVLKKADASLAKTIRGQQAIRNPCLHASLFTWKVAFTVFAADNGATADTKSRRRHFLEFSLNLAAVGLIRIYENFKSVAPCNCVQAFIFMLFRDTLKRRFEQTIFLRVFQNNSSAQELLRSRLPSPMEYFNFYVAVAEYLLKLKKISESTEWSTNFVDRMFAMATKLDPRDLPTVCETLAEFLLKHNHGSLESTRRYARTLSEMIITHLKKSQIQELENLARDSPDEWMKQILDDFSDVGCREKYIIRLMTLLVKDKDIGDILLSSYVTPLFSSLKTMPRYSISTVLSFLLYLLREESSLFQELGSWLLSLADSLFDDCSTLRIIFRANQVAENISRLSGVDYDFNRTKLQLVNKIRLPFSKSMFMEYIMQLDPIEELKEVDLERTVSSLPPHDFRALLEHFSQSPWLLPVAVWRKAQEMGDKGDRSAFDFALNQLCVGMSLKHNFYIQQMRVLREKYEKDKDVGYEVLPFLKSILDRRNIDVNIDDFVPLWITAVVNFSLSREQETRSVSDSIWEKLSRSPAVLPLANILLLSQSQPIDYVIRLLEILPRDSKVSAQKLSIWFPSWLCLNLRSFALQQQPGIRRDLSLRVICGLLCHHALTLFSFAVDNELKQSFNGSIFVLAILAVTDKKDACLDPIVKGQVVDIVSSLSAIPENKNKVVFVRSRLKTFFNHYAEDPSVQMMLDALKDKGKYLEKLRQDPLIQRLCNTYGY